MGGGAGQLVALNASNGRIVWQTHLRTEPGDTVWSSPALYKGSIYVGVASFQDCPQEFGRIARVNAVTGAVQSALNFSSSVPASCKGPGAWSSAAVDPGQDAIFFGTSNDLCGSRYQNAVVKLNPSTLAIESIWKVPPNRQQSPDSDTGATPMLFTASIDGIERKPVGTENKNGVYYVLDRTDRSWTGVDLYRRNQSDAGRQRVPERRHPLAVSLGGFWISNNRGRDRGSKVPIAWGLWRLWTRPPASQSGRCRSRVRCSAR